MKQLLKKISILCVFLLVVNLSDYAIASTIKQEEKSAYATTSTVTEEEKVNFVVDFQGSPVEYTMEKLDSDNLKVTTVTNGTEYHEVYVDMKNGTLTLDNEITYLEEKTWINEDLKESLASTRSGNWTPIYYYTRSISFSKVVNDIGICATVIGGIIGAAYLAGVAIATSAIASKIGAWASVVGLGSLAAGYNINGSVYYDTYRTLGLVPTGYGKNLTAYRYQDVGVKFVMKGKSFNNIFTKTGSWWFAEKPYSLL